MGICTDIDDFLHMKCIWVAHLSNGEVVYQDDGREGEGEPKAWQRLKKYVEDNQLKINKIEVRFYDHHVTVLTKDECDESDGTYFIKSADAFAGGNEIVTFGTYIFGYKKDGIVHTKKWKVPEIEPHIFEHIGQRKIEEDDPSYIRQGSGQST